MEIKHLFFALFFICFSFTKSQTHSSKTSFYSALNSQNIKEIDEELKDLQKSGGITAYMGALLIKKSGLISNPKEKLRLFKTGHSELETAIKKDSSNCEFRLLRLIIQENSPKLLKYNADIKKDATYLRKHYVDLSAGLQKIILDYSKKSKELKPGDFNITRHAQ